MCGIAGLLSLDGDKPQERVLRVMTDRLSHRGPDGEGFWLDGPVGLGHRRLAIIDLAGGRQPLANENETVWITFNGEIYNFPQLTRELKGLGHKFRTNSDTEVIVHAYEQWGTECLQRLRGMFAFALWDKNRRRLFLARDRVGIKPLFYLATPNWFAFASEMQALRELPFWRPTLDLQALDLYLHFQYVPAPFSIYREVRKLEPAHYFCVDLAKPVPEPRRYWDLSFQPRRGLTEEEWCERVDAALRETVQAHMISDVPYGAFLSGGVDSGTVVSYVRELLGRPPKTFTIGFRQDAFDESGHAAQLANHVGVEHHVERVDVSALELLPRLVRHYGEPFADSSAIPTYHVARLARSHVKMVLSGDGGDENFAGYPTYGHVWWKHARPLGAVRRLRFLAGSLLRRFGLRPSIDRPADTWFNQVAYFNEKLRGELWKRAHHSLLPQTRAWFDQVLKKAHNGDLCSTYQHVDVLTYLPNDILTKVDVASTCHGLEVRVPLLDHVFMETVAAIPARHKLRYRPKDAYPDCFDQKHVLKRAVARRFPPGFLERPKMGFSVPLDAWMLASLPEIRARLLDAANPMHAYFRQEMVKQLLEQHAQGVSHGGRIWALLFLTEWFHASGL